MSPGGYSAEEMEETESDEVLEDEGVVAGEVMMMMMMIVVIIVSFKVETADDNFRAMKKYKKKVLSGVEKGAKKMKRKKELEEKGVMIGEVRMMMMVSRTSHIWAYQECLFFGELPYD